MDSSHRTAAEQLLTGMHATCSHDLPNQVLSLQSLINLLDMDEAARLDASGQEYLRRLRAVSDKIEAQTAFLRSMVRLFRQTPQPREIVLSDLFRELKAEAASVLETPLSWDLRVAAGTIRADHELVYPSLGDLLRAMAEAINPKVAKAVIVTSSSSPGRTMIEIAVRGPEQAKLAVTFEKRCDVVLARERLRVAGVEFRVGPPRVDEASVLLEFAAERA